MQGQFYHDVGALAWTTLDADRTSKNLGSLLDAFQSEMAVANAIYVKANSPILNFDAKLTVVLN